MLRVSTLWSAWPVSSAIALMGSSLSISSDMAWSSRISAA
jgi:hypothetical protein